MTKIIHLSKRVTLTLNVEAKKNKIVFCILPLFAYTTNRNYKSFLLGFLWFNAEFEIDNKNVL